MSKIFELFGYRVDAWGAEAQQNMQRGWCPFMDGECDGGGNRYQSAIDLTKNPELQKIAPGKEKIQCGVCSLMTGEHEHPWIVCPRRLLSAKGGKLVGNQSVVRSKISQYSELDKRQRYMVWSEVKIKTDVTTEEDDVKYFDYTFDYIIAATSHISVKDAGIIMDIPSSEVKKRATKGGYALVSMAGEMLIEDFPIDPIVIIEVMTSSTSGGNKAKRTQIAMACEDAMLHKNHEGPGINYRQVWARMVSQLIVKSQVGEAWGGKTIWLVQDVLADYISRTTALQLPEYISNKLDEVNILAFGYGNTIEKKAESIVTLEQAKLYSGPIQKNFNVHRADGFIDIVKIGASPPKEQIWASLINKAPLGIWEWG